MSKRTVGSLYNLCLNTVALFILKNSNQYNYITRSIPIEVLKDLIARLYCVHQNEATNYKFKIQELEENVMESEDVIGYQEDEISRLEDTTEACRDLCDSLKEYFGFA